MGRDASSNQHPGGPIVRRVRYSARSGRKMFPSLQVAHSVRAMCMAKCGEDGVSQSLALLQSAPGIAVGACSRRLGRRILLQFFSVHFTSVDPSRQRALGLASQHRCCHGRTYLNVFMQHRLAAAAKLLSSARLARMTLVKQGDMASYDQLESSKVDTLLTSASCPSLANLLCLGWLARRMAVPLTSESSLFCRVCPR